MLSRSFAAAPLLVVLAALLVPLDAGAIPAFARRYRMSCTTCHMPFPQLKAYGEEFAGRGFAMPPGEEPARAELDMGDPLLQLPRELPLAVRFDGYATLQDRSPENDFQAPWLVKLLAGGRIAENVAFYGYYILERGEGGKLEDLYVQFTEPFGAPLSVLLGQFQLSDPIAKRELRLERLDYAVLRARVGASLVDLTYDRGLALTGDVGPVGAVLMLTNGNGIDEGAGDGFDKDSYKNVSLHLAADAGPVRVGAFALWGKEAAGDGLTGTNRTWYLGPQVSFALGELAQVNAVYLERRDSNPLFVADGAEVETRGGFAELVLHPQGPDGRHAAALLYNLVDSDLDETDAESAGVALSYLLRRNVRLIAEVDRDIERGDWIGSLGTVAAF
jgi:hypothetical protein